jgi:hypothetical protein
MTMAYLQLAENPYNRLADASELYIFVPAGFMGNESDIYVREDKFDQLPENEYQILMQKLAPYQNTGLSGKKKDARLERKDKRRTQKLEAKQKRVETRGETFGKIAGTVGNLVKNIRGGAVDVDTTGGGLDLSVTTGEQTFFERYKTPLILGGIALIGGGIILATRKKKR